MGMSWAYLLRGSLLRGRVCRMGYLLASSNCVSLYVGHLLLDCGCHLASAPTMLEQGQEVGLISHVIETGPTKLSNPD